MIRSYARCSAITLRGSRCTRNSGENGFCNTHTKISQQKFNPYLCSIMISGHRQCRYRIYISGRCRAHYNKMCKAIKCENDAINTSRDKKYCKDHSIQYRLEPSNCIVCLEEYDDNDAPLNPCGHYVHMKCLAKWKKDICPVCRCTVIIPAPIDEINLIIDKYSSILLNLGNRLKQLREEKRFPLTSITPLLCLRDTNDNFEYLDRFLLPGDSEAELPIFSESLQHYMISRGFDVFSDDEDDD